MDFKLKSVIGFLTILLVVSSQLIGQQKVSDWQKSSATIHTEYIAINFSTTHQLKATDNVVKTKKGIEAATSDEDASLLSDEIAVPIEKAAPFLGVGSQLIFANTPDGISAVGLELRYSKDNQQWSAWKPINPDAHLTTTADTLVGTLQYLPKSTAAIQFRISIKGEASAGVNLRSLRFSFTSPGATSAKRLKEINAKAKSGRRTDPRKQNKQQYPMPDYVSRTGWDCPDGQQPSGSYPLTDVTHQIVHHSAGTNSSNDWPAVVRAIWDYHVNTNGWSDIGYNWLVDPNGVVYQGRGWINGDDEVQGAHFCGTNSNTMGVCMMGNFEEVNPSEEAKESLSELLAWKSDEKEIDPLASEYHSSSQLNLKTISGHRDGCSTLCPGENLYTQLPQIRNRVKGLIEESSEPIVAVDSVRNYPNPFRETTNITFSLAEAGIVRLTVWNTMGQFVEEIARRVYSAGPHEVPWNASDYASGIYFCRIEFEDQSTVQKMVLVK
ncbi:N-acetylmuramoyl-L-alanine amidase [Fodinibius halophilus]|uniref:T9SS type A sorting domain-containing protein n=1 Tax=Fodinibius halophilus TaxID=1736908 RepID=A0A6M1TBH3_9BACT|nr:N-acetylmuramoyl-L-alanine amidase [Fodinibius halophilus]NGP87642.1 T9SS type A sorting domain-containing protein [Fodinibius halophilus]